MPVFAKGDFLRAVGDEYGWLGGIDECGTLRCVLPYTIVRKAGVRMVRFRVETIVCGVGLSVREETSFLNSVVQYFRMTGADVIIPATNNSIFRTYPEGADAAPYGSYIVDLGQSEEVLWRNISPTTRRNIRTAKKDGVSIREGTESLDVAYDLIRETFRRSRMPFMRRDAFMRFAMGLGEHGKLLTASYQGRVQSCCLFGFSDPCAHAVYGGSIQDQHQGVFKSILWEGICLFRSLGVRKFDFVGARIAPAKGSKQEAINVMKQRFGARLFEGYLWKYSLRQPRAWVYSVGVRLLRGGDIVDHERHKLNGGRALQ